MTELSRRELLHATACLAACGIATARTGAEPAQRTCEAAHIDVTNLAPGDFIELTWCGLPVLIHHRTESEIRIAQEADITLMRDPQEDRDRFPDPRWFVVVNQCTHLLCKVLHTRAPLGWQCVCHGSQYDASGRILSGPAQRNLPIPPFQVGSAGTIKIGWIAA